MNAEKIAALYAKRIKDGDMTKIEAISYYRNRHNTSYITALEAINIAIGELNEFGHAWDLLTEINPYATL
jgi:hypothetical protein